MEVTLFEGLGGERILTIQVGRLVSQGVPDGETLRNYREYGEEPDGSISVLSDGERKALSQALAKVWGKGLNYSLLAEKVKREGRRREESLRMTSSQPVFCGWVWSKKF